MCVGVGVRESMCVCVCVGVNRLFAGGGGVGAGAVLARSICSVFLVVFRVVAGVGLGGRRDAAGVGGRRGHRRVSGLHGRRTASSGRTRLLRGDEHSFGVTTRCERAASERDGHDIAKPSGEDKNPSYMRFAWVNLGLGVAWPKPLAWPGQRAVIGATRLRAVWFFCYAEADKTEERPHVNVHALVESFLEQSLPLL